MEPQPEHVLIARWPQTSQSGSAFGGRRADAAAASRGGPAAEGAEEGEVGEGSPLEDGPLAALDVFPPFFFVMGWYGGVVKVNDRSRGWRNLCTAHSSGFAEPGSPVVWLETTK